MAQKKRKTKATPGTDLYYRNLAAARRSVNASYNFNHNRPSASVLADEYGITTADAQKIINDVFGARATTSSSSSSRGDNSITRAERDLLTAKAMGFSAGSAGRSGIIRTGGVALRMFGFPYY